MSAQVSITAHGPGGKDVIMIASKEQLAEPSRVSLPEPEPAPGLIAPDGSINWGCPCLGGMATGPCGTQFRDAFSCFHYSEAEPKGSDCYEKFSVMQECMAGYPELYGKDDDEDELAAALDAAGDAPEPARDAAGTHTDSARDAAGTHTDSARDAAGTDLDADAPADSPQPDK